MLTYKLADGPLSRKNAIGLSMKGVGVSGCDGLPSDGTGTRKALFQIIARDTDYRRIRVPQSLSWLNGIGLELKFK